MQRHLTDKQKLKGKRHIESANDYIHHCYSEILRLKKFNRTINSNVWAKEIEKEYVELNETKERLANLERKYK